MFAIPLAAQKQIFSTYDWTQAAPGSEAQFREVWADVKTPGGVPEFGATADSRRTYAVGTIDVQTTLPGAQFSGKNAVPAGVSGFLLPPGLNRQVVVVQAVRSSDNDIVWQRYLYGISQISNTRATNARAISVWEADDPLNARIAVCGETYDEVLPESQDANGWTQANANHPSGFISVLNGNGTLLWSYHFFAGSNPDVDCAVTDLSIRVDASGNDIVTYCGISSHGLATSGTTYLFPVQPFTSPGIGLSDGATNHGAGQWDGFVGRLVRSGSNTNRTFHSIVGGPGTDGIFGLAEVTPEAFAVTGFTEHSQTTGLGLFPLQALAGSSSPYRLGFAMTFHAGSLATGLQLLASTQIGSGNLSKTTFPRDICIGLESPDSLVHKYYICGSTNDPLAEASIAQNTLNGPSDGFIVQGVLATSAQLLASQRFRFWGGPEGDGLTGINNWNEFPDHVATVGFTQRILTIGQTSFLDTDIAATTWLHNNSFGGSNPPGNTAPATGDSSLIQLRETILASTSIDRPAAMGTLCATVNLPFDTGGLGQESGGGVAVGNDGRINVVGMSDGADYPTFGIGSRPNNALRDAVRTELDMVPAAVAPGTLGVGRTDGTGFQPTPAYPPRNGSGQVVFTGGTTPACALTPFGRRVGEPAPPLPRMLIDYEGSAPTQGVTDAAILITRPTNTVGTIAGGVLQVGMPTTVPWLTLGGTDFWLGAPSGVPGFTYVLLPAIGTTTFRMPLWPLVGTGVISAQMVCLLAGPTTFASGCTSEFTASPALWLEL